MATHFSLTPYDIIGHFDSRLNMKMKTYLARIIATTIHRTEERLTKQSASMTSFLAELKSVFPIMFNEVQRECANQFKVDEFTFVGFLDLLPNLHIFREDLNNSFRQSLGFKVKSNNTEYLSSLAIEYDFDKEPQNFSLEVDNSYGVVLETGLVKSNLEKLRLKFEQASEEQQFLLLKQLEAVI